MHCIKLVQPDVWFASENVSTMLDEIYTNPSKERIIRANKPVVISVDERQENADLNWKSVLERGQGRTVKPLDRNSIWQLDGLVMFSSGTSGLPKAVLLNNLNLVASRCQARCRSNRHHL